MNELIQFVQGYTGNIVTPETRIDSFVSDSLEFLEFMLDVQKKFNIEIPDKVMQRLETIQDLQGALIGHVPA